MGVKIYIYILFSLTLSVMACKNDNPQRPDSMFSDESGIKDNPIKAERLEEMRKKSKPMDIPGFRKQAASILDFRAKQDSNSYAIIEADIWEYQFVFDGEMSEPGAYKGMWIDFKTDGTYDYGRYDQVQGSGRYNYHFERGELLMLDDNNSLKPQEWTAKSAGDALVLIGTATYKDNSVQMKLERTTPDRLSR